MEYPKEMQLKVLSKVHEIGRITVNEFDKIFPQGKHASLVFFYTLNERGTFSKTVEKSNGTFLYFYELNETGKGVLRTLEFEKKAEKHKKVYNRRRLVLAIAAGVGAAVASWPFILHWFDKF